MLYPRRWLGPDGLVHATYSVDVAIGAKRWERWLVCGGAVRDSAGVPIHGEESESVDVEESPAQVNCFGCLSKKVWW